MSLFQIEYYTWKNKQKVIETMNVKIVFNEDKVANVQYGFNAHYTNVTAKDSGMPIERYRLHSSIIPTQVIKYTHIKTKRTFTVSKAQGFVCYTADFLENGIKVGTIEFEDYYKD